MVSGLVYDVVVGKDLMDRMDLLVACRDNFVRLPDGIVVQALGESNTQPPRVEVQPHVAGMLAQHLVIPAGSVKVVSISVNDLNIGNNDGDVYVYPVPL